MAAARGPDGRFIKGGSTFDNPIGAKAIALSLVMQKRIGAVMEYNAGEAQNAMRTNAPWTDRTANARQGLFARAGGSGKQFWIVCYHTMPYGIWLEIKHSGKYAVIMPTVQNTGRNVMKDIRQILRAA